MVKPEEEHKSQWVSKVAVLGILQLRWTSWKMAPNLESSASFANLINEKPQVSGWL